MVVEPPESALGAGVDLGRPIHWLYELGGESPAQQLGEPGQVAEALVGVADDDARHAGGIAEPREPGGAGLHDEPSLLNGSTRIRPSRPIQAIHRPTVII